HVFHDPPRDHLSLHSFPTRRSSDLYMESPGKLPTEDQQFQVYKLAAEAMGTKKVVIRTADLGGDKLPESMDFPGENNPMMGLFSDRKSTRLNSSHVSISYAVFCLKK